MKKLTILLTFLMLAKVSYGQDLIRTADSLKAQGLLVPALGQYGTAMAQNPSPDISYEIAKTTALLWTREMRDTSFYFLNFALSIDSTLIPLYEPEFLSIVDDPRWELIQDRQIKKYEAKYGSIDNEPFAKELFNMIIKDQGFMYAGNIERRKYMQNGGYFDSPSIFPLLAMEQENHAQNQIKLFQLLDQYGWPTASSVTEYAAAGAALIVNHATYEIRKKYFPMLEKAFKAGEAQPLRYAKMRDRFLVEEGKEQLYGTQWKFSKGQKVPHPIQSAQYVDKRRAEIGLGPLKEYLKERFDIDWYVEQKN